MTKDININDLKYRNTKNEDTILREIADGYLGRERDMTQLGLSEKLGISISIVNKIVRKLYDISAVRIDRRSFSVISFERLMMYWATHRSIRKDITYSIHTDMKISEIESSMPSGIAFTAFSGYKSLYKESPADYSEVYAYPTETALDIIKERFGISRGSPNIIMLEADPFLQKKIRDEGLRVAPSPQIFVDLWNINTWYAKEFVDRMEERLFG